MGNKTSSVASMMIENHKNIILRRLDSSNMSVQQLTQLDDEAREVEKSSFATSKLFQS